MRLLEDSVGESRDYESIASAVGLSVHRFHHLFAEETNDTPGNYLRRVRLDTAAMRLRWTRESAGQVASTVGYESHSSFNTAFEKRFGVSPGRFRKDQERWPNVPVDRIKNRRITIRESQGFYCIAKRYFGPYKNVHKHWRDFLGKLPPGLESGRSLYLGLVRDDPRFTPPEQIRYDCCVTLGEATESQGWTFKDKTFQRLVTRPGLYARLDHIGTYRMIAETYSLMLDNWLVNSRYTMTDDPAIELYATPQTRVPEEDLRFTLMLPLY